MESSTSSQVLDRSYSWFYLQALYLSLVDVFVRNRFKVKDNLEVAMSHAEGRRFERSPEGREDLSVISLPKTCCVKMSHGWVFFGCGKYRETPKHWGRNDSLYSIGEFFLIRGVNEIEGNLSQTASHQLGIAREKTVCLFEASPDGKIVVPPMSQYFHTMRIKHIGREPMIHFKVPKCLDYGGVNTVFINELLVATCSLMHASEHSHHHSEKKH